MRFPIEPLADAAGITLGQIGGHQPDDHPSGIARLAELIGVKPRWARHLRHQGITEEQADKAATALGLHPITIWPSEWPQALLHGQLQGSARVHGFVLRPYDATNCRLAAKLVAEVSVAAASTIVSNRFITPPIESGHDEAAERATRLSRGAHALFMIGLR